MQQRISRRTMLRGVGAALALPILDSITATRAFAASAAVKPPVRMACLFFPNGMWPDDWIPKQALSPALRLAAETLGASVERSGAGYEMSPALKPLAALKDDFLVLTGLDKPASHRGDGHYAKDANFLTGTPVVKTTGKDISVGGISIDQFVAQKIGGQTPLPSLELGIEPVVSGIDSNVGYTRLYGSYISWKSPSEPVAREINPRAAYERLFGMGTGPKITRKPVDLAKEQDDRALLDLVLEDAHDLRKKLGRDDQHKLEEYLDAVRSVEQRIAFVEKPDPREWKPPTTPHGQEPPDPRLPKNHLQHVRLMLDMMVLAFWTDTTRVSTFMFGNSVSGRNFTGLIDGVKGGHHEKSHHSNDKEMIVQYSKIVRWHVEQLGYMMGKMKGITEGESNLLDNSMILFGSGMSDGNKHDPANLPILLAGHGGGRIKGGRHLAHPKGTTLCNLFVPMLECMGTPAEHFGDSSKPMAEIFQG